MACDETLLSAYLDDELDPVERRRVVAHVKSCPDCAAALNNLERVRDMLQAYAIPQGLHERMMTRVQNDRRRVHAGGNRLWWSVAAAAVIAVAIAGYVYFQPPNTPTPPSTPAVATAPAPERKTEPPKVVAQAPTTPAPPHVTTPPPAPAPQPMAATSLPLKLVGTVQGNAPRAVIVSKESGKQDSYAVGAEVLPGVNLLEVGPQQVILDDHGTRVVLAMGGNVAPERRSLTGAWALTVVDRRMPLTAHIKDAIGRVEATLDDELGSLQFKGTLSGRILILAAARPDGRAVQLEGELNDDFNTIKGIRREGRSDALRDRGPFTLVRIDEATLERERALAELTKTRQAELAALYSALAAYAGNHENRFPILFNQLTPKYVSDPKLYADTSSRKLVYPGSGKSLDDWAGDTFADFNPDRPMPERLVAYEQDLRRKCGCEAPSMRIVLEATYTEPDMKLAVAFGGQTMDLTRSPIPTDPAILEARNAASRSQSQNNLKQLGIVLKMFQGQHDGYTPGGWLSTYPEYLADASVLTAPWDDPVTLSYSYIFPAVTEEELMALSERLAPSEGGLDPNNPARSALLLSRAPIVYEKTQNPTQQPQGRNVLFADGHVEFLKDPGFDQRIKPFLSR